MTTTLNNYTIDDFLKLKPIIYEYCCNLTQKKNATSWYRDFSAADDLYQDLYIYVYDHYFNNLLNNVKNYYILHLNYILEINKSFHDSYHFSI